MELIHPIRRTDMSRLYKQVFAVAVAAAALVAYMQSPAAQEASGAEFDKVFMQQMVKDHEDALKLVQNTEEAKRIAGSLK
jgi:predicted outer membrane protein